MSQLKEFTTAANIGDVERINELLPEIQNSNLIDSCDPEGEPALHHAARNGHLAVMRILLSAGANPSVKDKWERPVLHEAAWYGKEDAASLLLDSNADIEALDKGVDGVRWKALHVAAVNGHIGLVRLLLAKGANPGYVNTARLPKAFGVAAEVFNDIVKVLNDEQRRYPGPRVVPIPSGNSTQVASTWTISATCRCLRVFTSADEFNRHVCAFGGPT